MADYEYWQSAVAGAPNRDLLVVGVAECGFWRKGRRDGREDPIAIWRDPNHGLVARQGFKPGRIIVADEGFCEAVFAWALKNPVTQEAYLQAFETGAWPDEAPPVAGIGHNLPSDPLEAIKLELLAEQEAVEEFLKLPITTQESADKAASWSARIAEIGKRAEAKRVEEKRPHDEAAKAVQEKWKPIVDLPAAIVRRLKDALTPFLKDQQRKAAEEAAKAAREQAVVKATENAKAGRVGRSVSLRTVVGARIVDADALYQAIKDYPDVIAVFQKIADRVIKAGGTLPGIEKHEEQKAV